MPLDRDALDALYRRYAPSVFRRARRILGNESEVHEVLQDVFLSLCENPEQFAGRSALTTFLYSVTTHACLNRIRNRKNRLRLVREHVSVWVNDEDPGMSPEQLSILHGMLRKMPEELARVAVYYYVDDLTQADIARILDCSRRHVGNLLGRIEAFGENQEAAS